MSQVFNHGKVSKHWAPRNRWAGSGGWCLLCLALLINSVLFISIGIIISKREWTLNSGKQIAPDTYNNICSTLTARLPNISLVRVFHTSGTGGTSFCKWAKAMSKRSKDSRRTGVRMSRYQLDGHNCNIQGQGPKSLHLRPRPDTCRGLREYLKRRGNTSW